MQPNSPIPVFTPTKYLYINISRSKEPYTPTKIPQKWTLKHPQNNNIQHQPPNQTNNQYYSWNQNQKPTKQPSKPQNSTNDAWNTLSCYLLSGHVYHTVLFRGYWLLFLGLGVEGLNAKSNTTIDSTITIPIPTTIPITIVIVISLCIEMYMSFLGVRWWVVSGMVSLGYWTIASWDERIRGGI